MLLAELPDTHSHTLQAHCDNDRVDLLGPCSWPPLSLSSAQVSA